MNSTDRFIKELDEKIQNKHLLKHDFYVAWSEGRLSKECLQEYAKDYYHHVKAFPMYLSAMHSHTEDAKTRKEILKNLNEEEGGSVNHPEMWRNFAVHLGAKDIDNHTPSYEIKSLISSFKAICSKGDVADGLSALYAYESQIPSISVSKIEGLKKYYGMKDPEQFRYFSVHIAADTEHARVEKELLKEHIPQGNIPSALKAADRILECLWAFLTKLCHQYGVTRCGV